MTLSQYIERRLGRGTRSQASNLLARPFGAASPAEFWRYWNPVFGYYLSYYFYRPLVRLLPRPVAVIATFACCGMLHDVSFGVLALVAGGRWPSSTITVMFLLIGMCVVVTQTTGVTMARWPVAVRWVTHAALIAGCWLAAVYVTATG